MNVISLLPDGVYYAHVILGCGLCQHRQVFHTEVTLHEGCYSIDPTEDTEAFRKTHVSPFLVGMHLHS